MLIAKLRSTRFLKFEFRDANFLGPNIHVNVA